MERVPEQGEANRILNDWEIVSFFHFTPNALIVSEDSPFKTVDDLVEYARENLQAVTLGGSGTYSADHLGVLRFEDEANIDLMYIPFYLVAQ